jgi:hypothetical protein
MKILSLPSYGNQNHFGHHQIQSPPMDGDQKGRILTNPLLFISVLHKDGQFLKVWSPTNNHNFSNGNQSFLVARKGGACHIFLKTF